MHYTRLQESRSPCGMECPICCHIRPCMDDSSYVPQLTPGKRQKHGLRKLDRGQICSSHLVPRHNSYQGTSTKLRTRNTRTHAWPSAHDQRRSADHQRPAFFPSGGRTGQTRFTFPRNMATTYKPENLN